MGSLTARQHCQNLRRRTVKSFAVTRHVVPPLDASRLDQQIANPGDAPTREVVVADKNRLAISLEREFEVGAFRLERDIADGAVVDGHFAYSCQAGRQIRAQRGQLSRFVGNPFRADEIRWRGIRA
jgi:hypothetical protein